MLTLDGLQQRYGEQLAIDALNLSVAPGEFFSLLGPSGCGKSTTLRLIGGFEQPSSGRIVLEGRDVTGLPPQRRNVNTVFQHYALFPHLTVWDNVAFGPRSRRMADPEVRRRVGTMLEIVGLTDLARRRPQALSGGQQQRVALARALVNTPALLLLDEPLAALDAARRRSMQDELKRIQRDVGVAFLMVSHDQQEVLGLSDRLAVLRSGRMEQIGTPRQIYEQPATAFVAGFVGQANLLRQSGGGLWMVRPERIRLSLEPPAAGEMGCRGRVLTITFQGSAWRVDLMAGDDQPITALLHQPTLPDPVRPGEDLWAIWQRGAGHALPATASP
ncbi:MAG: ABC transporter ATP-binding protein, partial [Vulcanococcus sp.]